MDQQQTTSSNIIDNRKIATHTLAGLIAMSLGIALGRGVAPDQDRDLVQVVSTALDRGQDFWTTQTQGYRMAHVVLFEHAEATPCGTASDRTGPFYCEVSERIYLDLAFLRAIDGDLARAYVIAHELGHHMQKITGELTRLRGRPISIELQADCLAGFWMRSEQIGGHLADGDLEAALTEAGAVGDDRIMPGSSPETWTHGSSAQRTAALLVGYRGGPCKLE